MLEEIQRRYSPTILETALSRMGVSREDCEELGGFEAHVFRLPGQVLKITHTLRRTADYIMGEVEFIEHLAARGMSLPRPIPSTFGHFVEPIPDGEGGHFLAYRFEEGKGRLTTIDDWDDAFLEEWGVVSGQINRLGHDFVPSRPAYRRMQWFEDPWLDLKRAFPPDRHDAAARCLKVIDRIRAFPIDPDRYGMIHGDLHHHNFFRDDAGKLVPFDFDDCEYGFDEQDIAIPLYYAIGAFPDRENPAARAAFAEHFLVHFARGFHRECPLSRTQLERIPDLLKMRSILLMAVLYTNVFPDDEREQRRQTILEAYQRRLDEDVPMVNLDFGKLARQIIR